MDPELLETIATVAGFAGITVVAYRGVRSLFSYLQKERQLQSEEKKKDYETRAERTRATKELMESEGYQKHLRKRRELTDMLIKGTHYVSPHVIERVLRSTFGEIKLEKFD